MLPDFKERLEPRAITPIRQSLDASCVVASISMVFSGFGIDIPEKELVDSYFKTAKLPTTDVNSGVTNTDAIKGIVQILSDRDLKRSLDFDVFVPGLSRSYRCTDRQFLVVADPYSIQKYGRGFDKKSGARDFFETLSKLSAADGLRVYTENARALHITGKFQFGLLPEAAVRGFYQELDDFIQKGHIIGPHGGMTLHARALDGTQREPLAYDPSRQGFMLHDPRGLSYAISSSSLVMLDSFGARGDTFDYLFRLSPSEGVKPKPNPVSNFLRSFRNLIP